MQKTSKLWLRVVATGLLLLLNMAAAAQSPLPVLPGFVGESIPTGLRPMGVDVTHAEFLGSGGREFAVVANSGENSVSILVLSRTTFTASGRLEAVVTVAPGGKIEGIPSPYAVAACPSQRLVLVTSPSDNSVRILEFSNQDSVGRIVGTVQTGPQPYSVACSDGNLGVVSNVGDNTLTIFSRTGVLATIPGVPGSRGFHGIAIFPNGRGGNIAWVAGTDANLVTLVDLTSFSILTQIPVSRPTAFFRDGAGNKFVASAGDNVIRFYGDNLQSVPTYQDVPNPQDAISVASGGVFAIVGGQDSLWVSGGSTGSITAGISGAASLAWRSFGSYTRDVPGRVGPDLVPVYVVLVTITGTNSVLVYQPQPSTPSQFRIANAASFGTSVFAPGSLASAIVTTGVSQPINASFFSAPLPKTLAGVTLKIGGTLNFNSITGNWDYSPTGSVDAPLHFVGPNQINFQVPPGIAPGGSVPAQVTKPDGSTLLTTLNISATAPGIFSLLQNGQGQGAVLNDDFSQNGLPQLIVGAKPARRGSVIQIFATGAGETDPPLLPGEPAPASGNPLFLTRVQPTVTMGGIAARVLFSGMAPGYAGLWQINAEVPASVVPGSAVSLVVSAGGVSSNTVSIAVE